jgi:ketosteroid isomerase-like protein
MADSGLATRYIEFLERRAWDEWSALLHDDVVYELPQTGEVVRGRANFVRFNREYPGDWHLTVRRTITEGDTAVVWVGWTMGGTSDAGDAIVFLEYDAAGLVTAVTDFWPERYEAPPGREHLVTPADRSARP